MSINSQGFDRQYKGKSKNTTYIPMETVKSNSRSYRKREDAKAREKNKRNPSEQLDKLNSMGYNAKRERARLKEQLRNQ